MIGSFEQFAHFLFNVKGLIEWGGTLLVCVIVFIETGFFVGFFLPGDSLPLPPVFLPPPAGSTSAN